MDSLNRTGTISASSLDTFLNCRMEKRKYGEWSKETMKEAIRAYKNKLYGFNECCRRFKIPKPTFKRHLDGKIKRPLTAPKKNGKLQVFSPEIEENLVAHILKLEECFFGLSITDVRRLAFQLAERNRIPHNFNNTTKLAGKKWFYSFMKRHPELSVRQPENTSIARAKGFNREAINKFFDILEDIVKKNGLNATSIYNVDESGFSTVQKKCGKIVGQKGKKRIGRVVSGERGINTTLVGCASASGVFVPPMIIYKRMRMSPQLRNGTPPGSLVEVAEHGFIVSELFLKWLQHFIDIVKPTKQTPVLLLLDGHTTHSKNLAALELARENGVILLQLPGHTTHRLQPLDVGVFGPMQTFYDLALDQWMTCHPGQRVTQFEVAPLITVAYNKAASIANAVGGFKATGCWPLDRLVFNDADFAPGDLLNKDTIAEPHPQNIPEVLEGTITVEEDSAHVSSDICLLDVSIEDLSPIPTPTSGKGKQRKTKAQGCTVLTSSPYKDELTALRERQIKKKSKLSDSRLKKVTKTLHAKESQTRSKTKISRPVSVNAPSTSFAPATNVEISVDTQEWFCFICEECRIEDMVQCTSCLTWVHESCAGCRKEVLSYICSKCS